MSAIANATPATEGEQTSIPVPSDASTGTTPEAAPEVSNLGAIYMEREPESKTGHDFGDIIPEGATDLAATVAGFEAHFEAEGLTVWQTHKESLDRTMEIFMAMREQIEQVRNAYQVPASVMPHKLLVAIIGTIDEEEWPQGFKNGSALASNFSAITNHSTPERYEMFITSCGIVKNAEGDTLKRKNPTVASYGSWLKALTGNVRRTAGAPADPYIEAVSRRRIDPKPIELSEQLDMLTMTENIRNLGVMALNLTDEQRVIIAESSDESLKQMSEWLTMYVLLRENGVDRHNMVTADGPVMHIGNPNG